MIEIHVLYLVVLFSQHKNQEILYENRKIQVSVTIVFYAFQIY